MNAIVAVQLSFQVIPVPVLVFTQRPPIRTQGGIHRRRRRVGIDIRQLKWWPVDEDFSGWRRPRNYRECVAEGIGTRLPCPWFGCRYHLGLDDGAADGRKMDHIQVKLRIDPEDIENHETCAMSLANRNEGNGLQVAEVAEFMNLSPGSIEAIERQAKWKLSKILGGNFKDWD